MHGYCEIPLSYPTAWCHLFYHVTQNFQKAIVNVKVAYKYMLIIGYNTKLSCEPSKWLINICLSSDITKSFAMLVGIYSWKWKPFATISRLVLSPSQLFPSDQKPLTHSILTKALVSGFSMSEFKSSFSEEFEYAILLTATAYLCVNTLVGMR